MYYIIDYTMLHSFEQLTHTKCTNAQMHNLPGKDLEI